MKALVMDIRENEAAVLDQEGLFRVIVNLDYEIGDQIEVEGSVMDSNVVPFRSASSAGQYRQGFMARARNIVAACFVFVLLGGSFVIPSSQVQAKGMSSITYKINIWNRVIAVEGDDLSGKEIAGQIHVGLAGRSLDDVIEETFERMEEIAGDTDPGAIQFEIKKSTPIQKNRTVKKFKEYEKAWEKRRGTQTSDRNHSPNISDPDGTSIWKDETGAQDGQNDNSQVAADTEEKDGTGGTAKEATAGSSETKTETGDGVGSKTSDSQDSQSSSDSTGKAATSISDSQSKADDNQKSQTAGQSQQEAKQTEKEDAQAAKQAEKEKEEAEKEQKEAEKKAKEEAKQAEKEQKEAEKAKKEAEKQAEKEKKEAEKKAKEEAKKAEIEKKEAEKKAKEEAKQAEKEREEAEKQAEKERKEAEKKAKEEAKQAEKEKKEAEKKAKEEAKQAEKEQKEAENEE